MASGCVPKKDREQVPQLTNGSKGLLPRLRRSPVEPGVMLPNQFSAKCFIVSIKLLISYIESFFGKKFCKNKCILANIVKVLEHFYSCWKEDSRLCRFSLWCYASTSNRDNLSFGVLVQKWLVAKELACHALLP